MPSSDAPSSTPVADGRFDAIIIGTGQAGPALAGRLHEAGMRAAIIERHLVGGTCVNTGCKPTKTLVASAYAAARRGVRLLQRAGHGGHGRRGRAGAQGHPGLA